MFNKGEQLFPISTVTPTPQETSCFTPVTKEFSPFLLWDYLLNNSRSGFMGQRVPRLKAGDVDCSGDVCAMWVRGLLTESPHSHSGLQGPLPTPTPLPRSRHTHHSPATEQPQSTLPERPSQHRLILQAQTQSTQMLALSFILSAASRVKLHLKLRNTWLLLSLPASSPVEPKAPAPVEPAQLLPNACPVRSAPPLPAGPWSHRQNSL